MTIPAAFEFSIVLHNRALFRIILLGRRRGVLHRDVGPYLQVPGLRLHGVGEAGRGRDDGAPQGSAASGTPWGFVGKM